MLGHDHLPGNGTPAHHTSESSSHDLRAASQHRPSDTPFPAAHGLPPPPVPLLTHAVAGRGSPSSAAPTAPALLPYDGTSGAHGALPSSSGAQQDGEGPEAAGAASHVKMAMGI